MKKVALLSCVAVIAVLATLQPVHASGVTETSQKKNEQTFLYGSISKTEYLGAVQDDYDDKSVVLMIDLSSSMKRRCRLPANSRMTRWDWCRMQFAKLRRAGTPLNKRHVDLVTFNDSPTIRPGVALEDVAAVLEGQSPTGNTLTAEALKNLIADYFAKKSAGEPVRPLLINILTDGKPQSQSRLRQVIINATRRMDDPDEITINFLHVGRNRMAMAAISDLDSDLVKDGAKFDIVHSQDFASLDRIGIAQSVFHLAASPQSAEGKSWF